jgi:hypothetical protein
VSPIPGAVAVASGESATALSSFSPPCVVALEMVGSQDAKGFIVPTPAC